MLRSTRALVISSLVALSLIGASAPAIADPVPDVPATGATVTVSSSKLYPHKDGYLDSLTIHAQASTADGSASTSTGVLTIKHGTATVKKWTISAAAPVKETWNGLVKSKIVSGAYTVAVTYTNADSSKFSDSAAVTVSAKKLVAHHWSKTVTAWAAHNSCINQQNVMCMEWDVMIPLPATHKNGVTTFHHKTVKGTELSGGVSTYNPLDYENSSSVALPSTIAKAAKKVFSVSTKVDQGKSHHSFYLSACGRSIGTDDAELCGHTKIAKKSETVTSPSVTMATDSTRAAWLTTVGEHDVAINAYYTVHVTYYTLG